MRKKSKEKFKHMDEGCDLDFGQGDTNARDICWKQARNLKDDRRGSVGDDEITQILQGGDHAGS